MKNLKTSLPFFVLLACFALAPAANAADPLSAEAQQSLEPSHKTTEGFEPGQHPDDANSPARRPAVARQSEPMTPEERQAARAKFENMTPEEREEMRQEPEEQNQEGLKEEAL